MLQYKEGLVKTFTEKAIPNFSPGGPIQLKPVVDNIFPLADVQKAHERMEANLNVGKIILEMP